MKKIFLSIIIGLAGSIASFASDFQVNIGDQYTPLYLKFDWVEEGVTCQTAADPYMSIEYGPNQYNPNQYEWKLVTTNPNLQDWEKQSPVGPNTLYWKKPGKIPAYLVYDDKKSEYVAYDGEPSEYSGNLIKVIGIGDYSFAGGQRLNTEDLVLPPTLEYIGKGAFAMNTQGNMQNTLDLKNLKAIGDYAFFGATWFIGGFNFENIDSIGESAFEGLANLKGQITFTNVKNFGPRSFYGCAFEDVKIENDGNDGTISASAFENCTSLTGVELTGVREIGDRAFFGSALKTLKFNNPNNSTVFGASAFENCTSLTGVELTGVREIGDRAFFGSKLKTIKINNPDNNTVIGESAFDCNGGGGSPNIHLEGVKIIGSRAFYGSNPTTIHIGDAIERIEEYAFYNSESTTNIYLGKNLTYIGDYAFAHCRALTSITIPDVCTHIGNYAFYECYQACPIYLGKSVIEIGDWAFSWCDYGCNSHVLEIPSSCKKIGVGAFMFNNHGVDGIQQLYVHATTPPDLSTGRYDNDNRNVHVDDFSAFGDIDPNLKNLTFFNYPELCFYPYVCLHVPMGSYEAYASDPYWGKFTCIMDDLLPDNPEENDHTNAKDPLSYIIGYAYMIPGEEINLDSDVLENTETKITWKAVSNEVVTVSENGQVVAGTKDADGKITPGKFGNYVALGYRDGNIIYDPKEGETNVDSNIAGAVVIFVCPTVTILYDKNDATNETPVSEQYGKPRKAAGDPSLNDLADQNSTYTHRVVYNSFPKFYVEVNESSIEIENIERAKTDELGNVTEPLKEVDHESQLIDSNENSTTKTLTSTYIVPLNPVMENRLISLTMTSNDGLTSGVKETEITSDIRVIVKGNILEIVGADDDDIVTVHNTAGQLVYKAANKTIQINHPGVYIVNVADAAFKAIVR